MALYTEQALVKMLHQKKLSLAPEKYTGMYYEDPTTKEKKYIVIEGQGGNKAGSTRSLRQERKVHRKKSWWPEEKKVEAATLHVAIGNMVRVAELTKVPIATLRKWQDDDWWLTTQQRVKREAIEETDAKFSKLIDKALLKLEKAVEEGDYMYDIKRGTLVQVPMTGRDLSIVAGTTFDKRQLLRGEATRITKTSDPEKHLAELAKRFAELARQAYEAPRIVEGQVLGPDAIQVSEAEEVLVQPTPQDSQAVGG